MSIIVPIGPYHPALHEPELFKVYVEGETIVDVELRLGYIHRGIEKLGESRDFLKNIYLAERVCGICGEHHVQCFVQAVEKLEGIVPPERAEYIRTIMLELERIHSHLLLLGVSAHEMGYDTVFMHLWGVRENLMDLVELISGNRKTYAMITIGGVRRDISRDQADKARKVLKSLKDYMSIVKKIFENDRTLRLRTVGRGVLSYSDAKLLDVVGPVARGSGVKIDIRADSPYAAYRDVGVEVKTRSEGDSWARFMVRIDEVNESCNIVLRALDAMPQGEYREPYFTKLPVGEVSSRVEAHRGELIHYLLVKGDNKPYRWRIRTPTYANLAAIPKLLIGESIAEIPINIISIDPCFSCTERTVTIVKHDTLEEKVVKIKDLWRRFRRSV